MQSLTSTVKREHRISIECTWKRTIVTLTLIWHTVYEYNTVQMLNLHCIIISPDWLRLWHQRASLVDLWHTHTHTQHTWWCLLATHSCTTAQSVYSVLTTGLGGGSRQGWEVLTGHLEPRNTLSLAHLTSWERKGSWWTDHVYMQNNCISNNFI